MYLTWAKFAGNEIAIGFANRSLFFRVKISATSGII
jgi:hypothetical protein